MPTTLAQYNPTSRIPPIEQVVIPQNIQVSTEAFDCGQLSLWTGIHDAAGLSTPQSVPYGVEGFVREFMGMLKGHTVVLVSDEWEPTQAVRPDEIRQLTRVVKRDPAPLALRPDVFRADDVLDELRELREINGPELAGPRPRAENSTFGIASSEQ